MRFWRLIHVFRQDAHHATLAAIIPEGLTSVHTPHDPLRAPDNGTRTQHSVTRAAQIPAFCAIIVAGGKSSRLNHTPKAGLSNGSQTLLERALDAAGQAHLRVVVGPETLPVPSDALHTREDPPYSGPAAALHAGLEKLAAAYAACEQSPPTWCLILGVDTPQIAPAVQKLLAHTVDASTETLGYWGVAEGVFQPLVGIYRFAPLRETFAEGSTNASVRSFVKRLAPVTVELDPAHTADVDTWEQAHELGYSTPRWLDY
ncbi:molybdopterin-guanine dinucleotide biosynthesis protein [Rothia dentocariosa]|uniref:Molybdopterin-guanine dinucleotide biosynthesis protein n=1 Tax=Rothia dentocariosa TaxID=2047 RepID=A0AAE5KSL6_9MICC|nr:molybdopterin-guanine dinucleotide biosynthesis protein [Rothia dentocariosa]